MPWHLSFWVCVILVILLQISSYGRSGAVEIEEGRNVELIESNDNDNKEGGYVEPPKEISTVVGANDNGNDFTKREDLPAESSLLPTSNSFSSENVIIASWDGAVYAMNVKSRNINWSFSSGSSLASHQTFSYDENGENATALVGGESEIGYSNVKDDQFLFCGKDWNLVAYDKRFGTKMLPKTPAELVSSTPHILSDGSIILGSRTMTTFLVDAKSGKVIHRYDAGSPMSTDDAKIFFHYESVVPNEMGNNRSEPGPDLSDVKPLFITRTDYLLRSYMANTATIQWNVSIAEIDAVEVTGSLSDTLKHKIKIKVYQPLSPLGNLLHPRELAFHQNYMLGIDYDMDSFLALPSTDNMRIELISDVIQKGLPFEQARKNCQIENNCLAEFKDQVDLSLSGIIDADVNTRTLDPENVGFSFGIQHGLFNVIVTITAILVFPLGSVVYKYFRNMRHLTKVNEKQVGNNKKKKGRKPSVNKNGISNESNIISKQHNEDSQPNGLVLLQNNATETLKIYNHRKKDPHFASGRSIGRMLVYDKAIDNGSNGTIILEGCFDGRDVAVKRLVRAYHESAWKEIQNLIASDQHPNIVRWYGIETDTDFVYVALERCNCSLGDLIMILSKSIHNSMHVDNEAITALEMQKIQRVSKLCAKMDIQLWNNNGCPSQQLLKLMRDVVSGLLHLHELGIIHRDLKPHNVLISSGNGLCAKLSDMGISKRLTGDASSLGHHATGIGSTGWRAPEQLLNGRQTRALDLFSLGCVLFFCITGGKHPFGAEYERDRNIVNGQFDLFPIEDMPEAVDLVTRLLYSDADQRPRAIEVLQHPFFWNSEKCLSFLREASDRVELEDREKQSDLLQALESVAPLAIGGTWDGKLEGNFLSNIGRYRRYKFDTVRDLLRVIRNKLNHYRELPNDIQELLGTIPEGFDKYFRSRFPRLLLEVYKVFCQHCREEEHFRKYFRSSTS